MIWRMQIEYIHRIGAKLTQRLVRMLFQTFGLVDSSLVRVALGGECEATVLPLGISGPGLLFAGNVHPRRINFIVALRLKVVEMFVVFIQVSDSRAGFLVGTFSSSTRATKIGYKL
jgi:hypothetical protein